MTGFITLLVLVILGALLATYAKKIQEGGFSPFEVKQLKQRAGWIAMGIFVVAIFGYSIVIVPVGYRMVLFNRFSKEFADPLKPGIGLVLPGIFERHRYDVRILAYTMSSIILEGDIQRADSIEVLSSDGLKMDLDITVRYRINDDGLNELHATVGEDYVGKIIRPEARAAIRHVFAQYEATEAYSTKREAVEDDLAIRLGAALAPKNVILDEVLLRNIQLPPTVVAAIEDKKAAQQEAERMLYVLEKEEQEKKRKIIEAEGDAEQIRIRQDALAASPDYLNWFAIEALNDNVQLVITSGETILDLGSMKAR
ncbi:prohibitin family protein [bacterium]|nr:prohibitin family protein [bacterium]